MPGIFAAVLYCVDLIDGPYIETRTDVHDSGCSVAGNINNVVAVQHANVGAFLCARCNALQKRLHDTWQPCRLQVGLPQTQEARGAASPAVGRFSST